ncbi:MAG: hypothetical protein IPL53_22305 [Ignavibacteria bacterium]|nr:hypothetical protein [Ignavibacteria bacterium]
MFTSQTAPGGILGLFNNSDVATLPAWQTAVGQDASSFQSDPRLINPAVQLLIESSY